MSNRNKSIEAQTIAKAMISHGYDPEDSKTRTVADFWMAWIDTQAGPEEQNTPPYRAQTPTAAKGGGMVPVAGTYELMQIEDKGNYVRVQSPDRGGAEVGIRLGQRCWSDSILPARRSSDARPQAQQMWAVHEHQERGEAVPSCASAGRWLQRRRRNPLLKGTQCTCGVKVKRRLSRLIGR
jgi:hypothetical protein